MRKTPSSLGHLFIWLFIIGCQSEYIGHIPDREQSNEAFFDDVKDYAVDTMMVLSADAGVSPNNDNEFDAG